MSNFMTTYFEPNEDNLRFMLEKLTEYKNSHIFESENKKRIDDIHKRWNIDECLDNNQKLQKLVGNTRLYFSYFYISTYMNLQAEIEKSKHNKIHQEIVHHYYDRDLKTLKDVERFKLYLKQPSKKNLNKKIITPQFKKTTIGQIFKDELHLSNFNCYCYAINTSIDYALPMDVCLNGCFYYRDNYFNGNAYADFTLGARTILGPRQRKNLFIKTIEHNESVQIFSTAMASLFRSISSSIGNVLYEQQVRTEIDEVISNCTSDEKSAFNFYVPFEDNIRDAECEDQKKESISLLFDAIDNFYSKSSHGSIGNELCACPRWFVEIYKQFDPDFKASFELNANKPLDEHQIDLLLKSLRNILIK